MAGDEMNSAWNMRADVADDRRLDRAHIGENGPRLEFAADVFRHLAACAHRHAQDDEIGPPCRLARRFAHAVGKPYLPGELSARRTLRVARDMSGKLPPPH